MAGGKFCLNRRHGITRAEHEAEVARRKRQHGRRGQAKSEEETTASDAHTSSLSRWLASDLRFRLVEKLACFFVRWLG